LPDDPSIYVVGTEEGSLHKCSVAYSGQYLETYQGHEAPLYRAIFSKVCRKIFLTCSADWMIGLYNINHTMPLAKLRSTGADYSVNDVCWCPGNSTVFASVTADARLQIWDLSVSTLDPVVSYDTNIDDVPTEAVEGTSKTADRNSNTEGQSNLANANIRYEGRYDRREDERDPQPFAKLLKNLVSKRVSSKRILTTVLFGETSPTIVIGDDKGTVTVYRVLNPITITHEGPKQQEQKLENAIAAFGDTTNSSFVQMSSAT
jgi:WD40 repeat protein